MALEFTHLFKEMTINGMTLKNRMMVSAMVTQLCPPNGFVNEEYIRYHETKAKGGWGLIVTENYPVAPDTGAYARMATLWTDEHIPGQQELTRRVHAAGAKICCQLYHAGATVPFATFGKQPVGPSAIRTAVGSCIPREMTREEIHTLIRQFGENALRVKKSGFDAVEIHAGHGYLLHEFLSPMYNKRTDEYGGSLYNRCRLLMEIITEVRKQVGRDFPLLVRLSSADYRTGGFSIADSRALAIRLEAAGVDCIDISQGDYSTAYNLIPPSAASSSTFVENARAIRSVVKIPITSAGKIYDPFMAESVLREGAADLVVMARTSLADPEFPNKVKAGDLDSIRNCIGCVQACTGGNKRQIGCHCLVNPTLCREVQYENKPAEQKKNIMIVGGGITGCEAAIAAAMRGHTVEVYEKDDRIGGQWIAAAVPIGKTEFNSFLYWQQHEMEKLGVKLHLNTSVTKEMVLEKKPDAVIIATGGVPFVPPIPGADLAHVYTAEDVLRSRIPETAMAPGKKIVVIGGGMTGSETADYLAHMGCKVTLIEMLDAILKDGEASPNRYVIEGLKQYNAEICTSSCVLEIGKDSVKIGCCGNERIITDVDTVVMAVGVKSVNHLVSELEGCGIPVIAAGDAAKVKNGLANILEGYDIGYNL